MKSFYLVLLLSILINLAVSETTDDVQVEEVTPGELLPLEPEEETPSIINPFF